MDLNAILDHPHPGPPSRGREPRTFCRAKIFNGCPKPSFGLAAVIVVAIMLAGCGYHFLPSGDHIDRQIKTVFLETFTNKTSEANVEQMLRTHLGDLFGRTARFRLGADRSQAQAVIAGVIESIGTSHLSLGKDSQALEERISMTLRITLTRQDKNQVIWRNNNLTGTAEYLIDRDGAQTTLNRREALNRLSRDLMERAYEQMMSGF